MRKLFLFGILLLAGCAMECWEKIYYLPREDVCLDKACAIAEKWSAMTETEKNPQGWRSFNHIVLRIGQMPGYRTVDQFNPNWHCDLVADGESYPVFGGSRIDHYPVGGTVVFPRYYVVWQKEWRAEEVKKQIRAGEFKWWIKYSEYK
jgi:hypothetical protein